ncbi:hypothetical protein EGR_07871 [Echinococcus granulosus]|uniref:Uncharacterized protein n=1 Tax=Echinococcus granulosus TaxID=6210 RepID=W6U9R3_ECHGR|nr:hypothetical protein EGR_07871 [Echinococcus granulosus]EUB57261.1 hypothetical protein EGR_07871 [Echinococcus granulosus]
MTTPSDNLNLKLYAFDYICNSTHSRTKNICKKGLVLWECSLQLKGFSPYGNVHSMTFQECRSINRSNLKYHRPLSTFPSNKQATKQVEKKRTVLGMDVHSLSKRNNIINRATFFETSLLISEMKIWSLIITRSLENCILVMGNHEYSKIFIQIVHQTQISLPSPEKLFDCVITHIPQMCTLNVNIFRISIISCTDLFAGLIFKESFAKTCDSKLYIPYQFFLDRYS